MDIGKYWVKGSDLFCGLTGSFGAILYIFFCVFSFMVVSVTVTL